MKMFKIVFDVYIFNLIDASPITTKYDKQRAFKNAYHLHELRCAVTLWKRQPGEGDFHQCDGIQYISQISTENTNVRRKKIFNFNNSFFSFLDKNSRLVNQQRYHS
jgi:hypothetical protein